MLADPHPGDWLMRHFSPLRRGVNVYFLKDGTVTPTWDGSPHGGQPFEAQPGTVIDTVWHGGHGSYPVTAVQQAALIAAGYAAFIS